MDSSTSKYVHTSTLIATVVLGRALIVLYSFPRTPESNLCRTALVSHVPDEEAR